MKRETLDLAIPTVSVIHPKLGAINATATLFPDNDLKLVYQVGASLIP